jgi:hypothetical protein
VVSKGKDLTKSKGERGVLPQRKQRIAERSREQRYAL